MVDDSQNIVTALSTILTTYYEQIVNDKYTLPCITYMMSNNTSRTNAKSGAQVKYSDVGYDIKLWAKSKSDINTYSSQIETKMNSLGYTLSGCRELLYGSVICLNMVYSGLGYEN